MPLGQCVGGSAEVEGGAAITPQKILRHNVRCLIHDASPPRWTPWHAGGANSEENHLFDVQTTVVGQENRDRPVKPRQASTLRSVCQRAMLTSAEAGLA